MPRRIAPHKQLAMVLRSEIGCDLSVLLGLLLVETLIQLRGAGLRLPSRGTPLVQLLLTARGLCSGARGGGV